MTFLQGIVLSNICIGTTNGEVIKALFPHIEVRNHGVVVQVKGLDCDKGALDPYKYFWKDWWDAPYQKGCKGYENI